jgi:hypothetical protein
VSLQAHDEGDERLVETVPVLFKQLAMVADAYGANAKEMVLHLLCWLLGQLNQDEGVGLDVGDELLLLLEDVLEVLRIFLRILLVFEFFHEFLLAELYQLVKVPFQGILALK